MRCWLNERLDLAAPEPFGFDEGERQQLELSRQLVRLVDVLYALVLVQGALYYRSIFQESSLFRAPVVLALVLIYYTVIRSFVDYHIAMEGRPYQILRRRRERRHSPQSRLLALWQVYADVVIVGSYSYLLLKAHRLMVDPGASLRAFFWALGVVFILYIVWGAARAAAHVEQEFSVRLLAVILVLYLAIAGAYEGALDSGLAAGHVEAANIVGLAVSLVVMVGYRHLNWGQQRASDQPAPNAAPPGVAQGAVPSGAAVEGEEVCL